MQEDVHVSDKPSKTDFSGILKSLFLSFENDHLYAGEDP